MSFDAQALRAALAAASPGINGADELVRTAVLALLSPEPAGWSFVFQLRAAGVHQGGELSFPGGRFEPGLDTDGAACAVRETAEEMGLDPADVDVLGPLDRVLMPAGFYVEPFLGVSRVSVAAMHPDPQEVERIVTAPLAFFLDHEPEVHHIVLCASPTETDPATGEERIVFPARELGLPERYGKPWGGGRHAVYAWRLPEGTLWGMTARVVRDAVKRMRELR